MRCRSLWLVPALLFLATVSLPANPPRLPQMHLPHLPAANIHVVNQHEDFDLQPTDDAKVRLLQPPVQYDEKGNPKKFTAAELKELKGPDTKLVGYKGDLGDLKVGQIVTIHIVQEKAAPKAAEKKDAEKKENKDSDKPTYVSVGEVSGQLVKAGGTDKKLTLRVTYQTLQAGGNHLHMQQNQPDAKGANSLMVSMIVVDADPDAKAGGDNKPAGK